MRPMSKKNSLKRMQTGVLQSEYPFSELTFYFCTVREQQLCVAEYWRGGLLTQLLVAYFNHGSDFFPPDPWPWANDLHGLCVLPHLTGDNIILNLNGC